MAITRLGGANAITGTIPNSVLAAGNVIQVVSATKTDTYSENIAARGTGVDITGLTVDITPTSTSSKLVVYVTMNTSRGDGISYANFIIHRDGSPVIVGTSTADRLPVTVGDNFGSSSAISMFNTFSFGQVDAGSTSSTTFSVRLENAGSSSLRTFNVNRSETDTNSNQSTRATSSIMVMEVSA